ncbi:MAG: DsbC family protein [Gammaproteobacteria bacterium]|nr:DsbC family protein [Gammaproteobacteria bacterium]
MQSMFRWAWIMLGVGLAGLANAELGEKLVASLEALNPELEVVSVSESGIDGLVLLELAGGGLLYGTPDGRHLIDGSLYRLGDGGIVNLTEQRRAVQRRELLAGVDAEDMVVFAPEDPPKASVAVFTDVDCGYCRKLHMEIDEINALGIEVRYLAFPRAGPGSRSYEKTVSAWCAKDAQHAITELKMGRSIPDRSCANPVMAQYELGQAMGVTGTPAIVTEAGNLLPGYLPAADLAAALGL